MNPQAALDRLDRLHQAAIGCLETQHPAVEYCRLVGLETFWHHNLDIVTKEAFTTPASYARYVSSAEAPAQVLQDDVGSQIVADAAHSWMVPYSELEGLTSAQARAKLRFHRNPPYAVMVFSVAKMVANDVLVRDPCGLDVIPGRILDWYPGNVTDEKIDGDIPRAALDRIEWLP